MSTATDGRRREYQVRNQVIDAGWVYIMRAAGSKGPADLLMAHNIFGAALVQVGSKSKLLGPDARQRLLTAAKLCHALPFLAIVIPRKEILYWVVSFGMPASWERWTL